MSQQNASGIKTFTADAALEKFILVKPGAAAGGCAACDVGATHTPMGVTQDAAASGDPIAVRGLTPGQTYKVTAAGAVTYGALVYAAASGKCDDAVSGNPIGWALEAASASGDIFEIMAMGNIPL